MLCKIIHRSNNVSVFCIVIHRGVSLVSIIHRGLVFPQVLHRGIGCNVISWGESYSGWKGLRSILCVFLAAEDLFVVVGETLVDESNDGKGETKQEEKKHAQCVVKG
uniref:Uncharacterized protein n=1 Tax=Cacopsylla melanoneura TaxID=428564 RepID=A0A8D8XE68_9HEMI